MVPIPQWRGGDVVTSRLLIALLLLVGAVSAWSLALPPPVTASAPAHEFSAARGAAAAAEVVSQPRPIGSAPNAAARASLADRLTAAGFSVEEHTGVGHNSFGDVAVVGFPRSLIATRPGTDPSGTVVLATHLDSIAGAPGAADAGVGIAVILESVRALGPQAQRNDLVVLLVDGEEDGLLGAAAFVADGAQQLRRPVLVLNHEARGVSGRPMVTRIAGPVADVLSAMPRPEYESFTDALFEIVPNDTDFSVYRESGWWGADLAMVGGSWAYHTPQDDAAHLDSATLQRYGEMSLAMTSRAVDLDLGELVAEPRPVLSTAPWGIVTLAPGAVTALGLLAPVSMLGLLVLRRRRGTATLRGAAVGALLALVGGVVTAVAATGLWTAVAAGFDQFFSRVVGEPVRPGGFLAAEVLLAVAALSAMHAVARRRAAPESLGLGAAVLVSLLVATVAVLAPGLGSATVAPVSLAGIGALVAAVVPSRWAVLVRAVTLLPLGWLLGPQLVGLVDFGISSSAGALAGTVLLVAGAAAPVITSGHGRADSLGPSGRSAVALLMLALVCSAGGVLRNATSPEPRQEIVTAEVDSTGATRWRTTGATAWGRELAGVSANSDLVVPQVRSSRSEGSDRVEFVIASRRGSPNVDLTAATDLTRVQVNGVSVADGGAVRQLRVRGLAAGQRVQISAELAPKTEVSVADVTHDLSIAGGWRDPGREVSVVRPELRASMQLTV